MESRNRVNMVGAAKPLLLATAIALAVAGCAAPRPPAETKPEAPVASRPARADTIRFPTAPGAVAVPPLEDEHRTLEHEALDPRDPQGWLAKKKSYHSDTDGFAQVIQGQDYETIEAIQAWYGAILGSSQQKAWGIDQRFEGVATGLGVRVRSPKRTTEVVLDAGTVRVGSRTFSRRSTRALFSSLSRLIGDLEETFGAAGVRGTRYSSRAYQDVVRIEFCYPPLVVAVAALWNGIADPSACMFST